MKNLSLFVKLGAGFGVVLLLVVIMASFIWNTMKNVEVFADLLEAQYLPIMEEVAEARTKSSQAIFEVRGYNTTFSEETRKNYLANIATLKKTMERIATLNKLYPRRTAPRIIIERVTPAIATLEDSVEKTYIVVQEMLKTRVTLREDNLILFSEIGKFIHVVETELKDEFIGGNMDTISTLQKIIEISINFENLFNDSRTATWYGVSINSFVTIAETEEIEVPELHAMLDEIEVIAAAYPDYLEKIILLRSMVTQYGTSSAKYLKQLMFVDENKIIQGKAGSDMDSVFLEAFLNARNSSGRSSSNIVSAVESGIITLYIITFICIILAILVATALISAITKPMLTCLKFAQGVAAGNLDADLPVHQKDEIGKLCDSLRAMVASLKEKIEESNAQGEIANKKGEEALVAMQAAEDSQVQAEKRRDNMMNAAERLEQAVNIISSASTELSAQIEQSERGSVEQASRVGETATAMTEMNATVLEVAKSAGEASEISLATRKEAEDGAIVVQKSVASIRAVQEQALKLKEDMSTLDENAKSIGQIMSVISDIADQTNLLALNAAIEAARAGEAGRGFAVVADEVRKLAEKTMDSTSDVGKAISAIQNSTAKSVLQMDEAMKSVLEATEYADQSGEALEKIVKMVDATVDQARSIATAAEQQSATSEEINNSIEQVNAIAVETARAMQEAAVAVVDLSNQAQLLTSLVEELKS